MKFTGLIEATLFPCSGAYLHGSDVFEKGFNLFQILLQFNPPFFNVYELTKSPDSSSLQSEASTSEEDHVAKCKLSMKVNYQELTSLSTFLIKQ
jgi:hypothetical protein